MALQLTVGQTVSLTAPEVATGAGLDAEPLPGGVWQFSTWPEHVLPPGLSVAGGKLSGTVADGATLDDATAYVVHLTDSPVYDDVTGQAYLTVTAAVPPGAPDTSAPADGNSSSPLQVAEGSVLSMTAEEMAAALGLTKPFDQVWEVDTARSTAPAGVTVERNNVHGTVAAGSAGDYRIVVFYHSSGGFHQVTTYAIHVVAPTTVDPSPTPTLVDRVLALVELVDEPDARKVAEQAVPMVTVMAKAYTRGAGFITTSGSTLPWTLPVTLGGPSSEPNEEISAVILTASARLLANPSQLGGSTTVGPFSSSFQGGFTGWTLAEQFVLNRYRKRAH